MSRVLTVAFLVLASASCRRASTPFDEVEIVRDRWGIAHVYGDSSEAAFFGAGYATAEDRLLQMSLRRRVVQGRIAEVLGRGPDDRFLKADRRMRILGMARLRAVVDGFR